MKILNLLEGTIKVPENVLNDIMTFVCSDLFSRAFVYLSDPEVADEYYDSAQYLKKLIVKCRNIFGDFQMYQNYPTDGSRGISGTCYVSMADVDQRYFKQNKSNSKRTYKLDVMVHAHDEETSGGKYSPMSRGSNAKMVINTPAQDIIEATVRSPEMFEAMIRRIRGTVNHELAHGVQDMALKQINGVDYYKTDGGLDYDKYHSHSVEYSPQIISSVHDFLAFVEEVENIGPELTPEERKQLIRSFVDPAAKAPRGATNTLIPFFETLYRIDKVKWKKAVKYFYDLVQNKAKEPPQ